MNQPVALDADAVRPLHRRSHVAQPDELGAWSWPDAGLAMYERYNRLLGEKVVAAGAVRWRQVRPFFFAPLLPCQPLSPEGLRAPPAARWGGFYYAVAPENEPNAWIQLQMFQQTDRYAIHRLDYNRRRQLRIAAESFEIRPVPTADEFARAAHPVYCNFYARTRYPFGRQRRDPAFFRRWAMELYRMPGLLILGGYCGDRLCGVSISMRVGQVLLFMTYFCDTTSMRMGLSDLMLHVIRVSAANTSGLTSIYLGSYKAGRNDFYALRGAQCVRLPARLQLNPLAKAVLRRTRPALYARLRGSLPDET